MAKNKEESAQLQPEKVPEEKAEESPKLPPVMKKVPGLDEGLWVKNIVRRRDARMHRMVSPIRHRFKQYIAGRRILRGQSTFLSKELAVKAGPELLYMIDLGTVVVADVDRVTFMSYEDVEARLKEWGVEDRPVIKSLPVETQKIAHDPGENAPKAKRTAPKRKPPKRPKKQPEEAEAKPEEKSEATPKPPADER